VRALDLELASGGARALVEEQREPLGVRARLRHAYPPALGVVAELLRRRAVMKQMQGGQGFKPQTEGSRGAPLSSPRVSTFRGGLVFKACVSLNARLERPRLRHADPPLQTKSKIVVQSTLQTPRPNRFT